MPPTIDFKRWIRSQRSPFSLEEVVEEGRGGGRETGTPPSTISGPFFPPFPPPPAQEEEKEWRKKGNFGSVTTANQPEKKATFPHSQNHRPSTFDIRSSSKEFFFIYFAYESTSIIPRLFIAQQIFLTFQVRNIEKGKEHGVSRRRRLDIGTADPPTFLLLLGYTYMWGPSLSDPSSLPKISSYLAPQLRLLQKKSVASTPLDPPVREGSLVVPLTGLVGGGSSGLQREDQATC